MRADIDKIISEMTIEEKISLCSGADSWTTKSMVSHAIPSILMTDGPHGLRKQTNMSDIADINSSRPATCFPAACSTACSWDESILYRIGAAIGEEASCENVSLVLGPGLNIKRNPLCGRNFEYFSEDPILAGKMGAAYVQGMEGVGVGACVKHFACNNQERARMSSNSVISDRALREIYLRPFEIAVTAGKPSAVMCSYNKINGVYSSDNENLLTGILRDEWGFGGVVITDWGAMSNRIKAFKAGCDLNMPGGSNYMEKACLRAIRKGTLSETDIDRSVKRILKLVLKYNDIPVMPGPLPDHNDFAAHAAAESAVLLKNEDSILPLKKGCKTVLIGAMAKNMRYQGSGSSHITPSKITNPTDAMPDLPWVQGCLDNGDTNEMLIEEAREAALNADVAIVFAGLPDAYESEGFDRSSMRMPSGHVRMISEIADVNPNTVVILMCGSPVECHFADSVKAILYMGLPGQAGGEAVRKLLFGDTNPSGRLAETWPIHYEDCVSAPYYSKTDDALYLEDIYVGYRYYDKAGIPVRWPFGYGLSYTTFEYSDLVYKDQSVSVTVTNTGNDGGSEVVQLYIALPQEGIHKPVKELKSFKKVYLEKGESCRITFPLNAGDFAIWNNGWHIQSGTYRFLIGGLSESVDITYEDIETPLWQSGSWFESFSGEPDLKTLEFQTGMLYKPAEAKKGSFTVNNSIAEMKDSSFIMKQMYKAVSSYVLKHSNGKADPDDPAYKMMLNMAVSSPLRAMQINAGLKDSLIRGLVLMANGHFFKGLARMLRG